jgi:hypothetical protein
VRNSTQNNSNKIKSFDFNSTSKSDALLKTINVNIQSEERDEPQFLDLNNDNKENQSDYNNTQN